MNLGGVYFNVLWEIAAYTAIAVLLVAVIVRWRFRVRKRVLIPVAVVGWGVVAFFAESLFHHGLYVRRHRAQNDRVPDIDYVSYQPKFNVLHAVGPMSLPDLEAWLARHPEIGLAEVSSIASQHYDESYFGVGPFDRMYATKSADNGRQYRLYWKQQQVFISYNAF